VRNLKYVLLMVFTLAMFTFIADFKNSAPIGGKFGIAASVAQQVVENGDTFEIVVKDKYGNEEKVVIPRGESIVVSERENEGQLEIVVAPNDAPQAPGYGEPGGNPLLRYNPDGSPLFQSSIPLKQSDPWGLLGW